MRRVIYAICNACNKGYNPQNERHHCAGRYYSTAQLNEAEKPRYFYHPEHPEWGYKYPGRLDTPMPDYYEKLGYKEAKIDTVSQHAKFCDEQGLVNHKLEGIRDTVLED
jgi:hypothetical protein